MIILTIILFIFLIFVCLLIGITTKEEEVWTITFVILITTILIAIYSIFVVNDIRNNEPNIFQQTGEMIEWK